MIAPGVAGSLLARLRRHGPREERPRLDLALSARELDVLRLIVSGCNNMEIGGQLHLSSSTIKHHVSIILDKLGVENRIQAAVLAVQQSVVEVSAGGGS